jgi:tetratricopeptide (TPR) repeat protein
MTTDASNTPQGQRIDSWKEIAAFFGRDERTVKRWETLRGLPVHRVPGGARGSVYAYSEELTAWLRSSEQRDSGEVAVAPTIPNTPDNTITEHSSENAQNKTSEPIAYRQVTPVAPPTFLAGSPNTFTATLPSVKPPFTSANVRWIAAFVLAMLTASLLVFPRYFELRSVQGRVLPAVTRRTESAKHAQAQDLYLQGRYYWNKRTPDGLTVALDEFTKATQLDPNYALAYAGQADCYNLLREYTSMPPSQAFPLAISAAKKSLELDDMLPEGHRALGFAYFYWNWDLAGGEREFRRAIALNPNDVEAHHWYATALVSTMRYPEALAEIEIARQLDPSSPSITADRAVILSSNGRQDEGIAVLLALEKSDPEFLSPYTYLGEVYFGRKEYLKSFEQSERAAQLSHDQKALAAVAAARQQFLAGGEPAMLQQMLSDRIQGYKQGNTRALDVASTYALLNQNKEAFEYLEKAYQLHEYELLTIGDAQAFQHLRTDPHFQELMHRLGLAIPHSN